MRGSGCSRFWELLCLLWTGLRKGKLWLGLGLGHCESINHFKLFSGRWIQNPRTKLWTWVWGSRFQKWILWGSQSFTLLCTVPYCTALPSALFTKQPAWGMEYQGYHGLWYSEQILTMYITTKGTSTLEWCYYIHQTIGRMEYLGNHWLQYPGQKSWEKWCSVPICCLFPLDAVLSSGLCDMLNRLTNYLMLGFLLFLFWSKGNQEKRLYR